MENVICLGDVVINHMLPQVRSASHLLIAHVYIGILKRHTYNNTPNVTGKLVLVIHLSIIRVHLEGNHS
jgi:hypothetical protein